MKCLVSFLILIQILLFTKTDAQEAIEIDAVADNSVELPCNVTSERKDDKLNILAWYKNGSATAFYSRDLRNEDPTGDIASVEGGGRYRLVESEDEGVNYLEILSVKPSDAGLYHCFADFAASPAHKTYIALRVIEPPQRLWIVHENGTRVATASAGSNASQNIGPFYVGDTLRLFCVAFGGKPLASLSWWMEDRMLKNSSTPLSEHRVRSDLQWGPLRREDHGLVVTCRASNNDVAQPITIDVILDMYLSPELVSIRDASSDITSSTVRARAGETLRLSCRVLGARPTPTVLWKIDGNPLLNIEQNVTVEASQRLVLSEIQLWAGRELDEAQVRCCARAYQRQGPQLVCARALPLTVLYPPVIQITAENEIENNTLTVVKSSNVTLNCSYVANPLVYQMVWFHEDNIKPNGDEDSELTTKQILYLHIISEADAGEYLCSATNDEGTSYSEPLYVDVTYPAYCENIEVTEYGLGENESVNLTCKVSANPKPQMYRWVIVNEAVDSKKFMETQPHSAVKTENEVLLYQRPNETEFSTVFCWGVNGVRQDSLPSTPCTFLISDETVPHPPADCKAVIQGDKEIAITCQEGHNGGLPQKFKFTAQSLTSDSELVSIVNLTPKFIIREPSEDYKLVIIAFNEKGSSEKVEISKEDVGYRDTSDEMRAKSAVPNIALLALSLCSGVAVVALAACGLVLCARDSNRPHLTHPHPPLCAYNTEESNCETYNDSDDSNECNVKRTESFKRAVSRYPSRNLDVRRSSSFHSSRHVADSPETNVAHKYSNFLRHQNSCRVHSLQNINRKKEMDSLCDHLVMQLPNETSYHVPKPQLSTFYTIPRQLPSRSPKHISDDTSEITQNSDGFSLPPPPDELGTYRAASRIKDFPIKSTSSYSTINRKKLTKETPKTNQSNVIMSQLNTVGLPTVSSMQGGIYSYPSDDHQQVLVSTNPFEDSP